MGYGPTRTGLALGVVLLGLVLAPAAGANPVGVWSPVASMGTARYGAAAAALSDGRVLVAGGLDGSGSVTASAEVYTESTNTWTPVASMASARELAAAAPLPGDRVLVAGGDVDGVASSTAEIFDGTTDTWSATAPMNYARAGAVAAGLSNGTVWVAEGSTTSPSGEIYNPANSSWSLSGTFQSRSGAPHGRSRPRGRGI